MFLTERRLTCKENTIRASTLKFLLTSPAYNLLRTLLDRANTLLKKLEEMRTPPVPSPLEMKNATLVLVEFKGRKMKGWYSGPCPDGGYAVRLTNGMGLYAFSNVELA